MVLGSGYRQKDELAWDIGVYLLLTSPMQVVSPWRIWTVLYRLLSTVRFITFPACELILQSKATAFVPVLIRKCSSISMKRWVIKWLSTLTAILVLAYGTIAARDFC